VCFVCLADARLVYTVINDLAAPPLKSLYNCAQTLGGHLGRPTEATEQYSSDILSLATKYWNSSEIKF